jgi:hypothetical protein
MPAHFLVNRTFDIENEMASKKRGYQELAWKWVIWSTNGRGDVRRSDHGSRVQPGRVLAESLRVFMGRREARPTWSHISCRRFILFTSLTPASATQLGENTAADFAVRRNYLKAAATPIDIWRVPLRMTAGHHKQN